MWEVGVIGATGYTGLTLISILKSHPHIKINLVTSNTYKGKRISEVFPLLRGIFDETLVPTDQDHRGRCDVFFLCLPHGKSMDEADHLYDNKSIIIDLSADFRFEDIGIYEKAYLKHRAAHLIPHAVFGLPELYRDRIKKF